MLYDIAGALEGLEFEVEKLFEDENETMMEILENPLDCLLSSSSQEISFQLLDLGFV